MATDSAVPLTAGMGHAEWRVVHLDLAASIHLAGDILMEC